MSQNRLHLLESPAGPAPSPPAAPCRRPGCATLAAPGPLGFCPKCLVRYRTTVVRRRRLVDAVCARLAGDPLFVAFGGRPRAFGSHVVAHLEELDAQSLHVPRGAVEDYVAELDETARSTG